MKYIRYISDIHLDWDEYFYYDETSPSCLRWKVDILHRIKKGDICGYINTQGYWSVMLQGVNYLQHRIIYEMLKEDSLAGYFIDHIDGHRENNLINNLKKVSKAENNRNCKISKNNKSGITGVYSVMKGNKKFWVAKWRHLESKQRHKYFSVFEYGDEEAKAMAAEFREAILREMNAVYGFMYSERHITGELN